MTSFAHNTHYYSLVPMAWALRAAGHEVRVASQPSLTETITGSGLTAVPVGDDEAIRELLTEIGGDLTPYQRGLEFTEARPESLTWEYLLGRQTMLAALCFAPLNGDSTMDDMVALARDWQPDLVIWEPFTYAGPVAARAVGAAHARLLWGPDVIGHSRRLFTDSLARRSVDQREDPMAEWLRWTLQRYGCLVGDDEVETLITGEWTIDPGAGSTRLPTSGHTVPMRYVPYNGPSVVPDWVSKAERTRVCVTLGVSARETYGKDVTSFQDLLGALGDLDIEVIATLSSTQLEDFDSLPDNVRVCDFVPLDVLLPSCAAIIHHGGAGTWSTAMLHGVPQIMIAGLWDAPLKAQQAQRLGSGISIPPDSLDAGSLRDAVVRVLGDPSITAAARRLRDEMLTAPSPAEVVRIMERLTAHHGSGRPAGSVTDHPQKG
ncbi:activator-dependent family glycosyltransferase [Streptomyces sp. ACA25]|uniref:activator-dependent family glycosyltransferase n=1 Tax=Streptomyces sp. ACA25 TaxID=3022596 RepID=UPI002307BA32|nr:activator-dependent family glycosyltransferase [Streptomyces sp. ACA25]MDB1090307.1 activator-dependent family glycosyltransferase [Streptomyces sp. ACA25]